MSKDLYSIAKKKGIKYPVSDWERKNTLDC